MELDTPEPALKNLQSDNLSIQTNAAILSAQSEKAMSTNLDVRPMEIRLIELTVFQDSTFDLFVGQCITACELFGSLGRNCQRQNQDLQA